MRNIGLMALALESPDDPCSHIQTNTGPGILCTDYFLKHDGAGGLLPEGFGIWLIDGSTLPLQLLLLFTRLAGDDPAKLGPQVVLGNNTF